MNKQEDSIERFNSYAARLSSVKGARDIVRNIFECKLSWFDPCDPLIVEGVFPELHLLYVCTMTSSLEHRTFIECRFHFNSCQMWIGSIQVAARYRQLGVGRQLVRVTEAIANALGMKEIRIFPMPSSVDFWLKLDYIPDSRSARVLWKKSADYAKKQMNRRDSPLCMNNFSEESI